MAESNNLELTDITSMTFINEDGVEYTTPWKIAYTYKGDVYFIEKERDEAKEHWNEATKSSDETMFDDFDDVDTLKYQMRAKEIAENFVEQTDELGEIDDSNCKPSGEQKMSYYINKYINKNRHNKRCRRQYGGE